jgi:phosphoglycolate phosphatase
MKYSLLIFDLDGTLLDTSEGVVKSLDYTIETLHLKKLSLEEKLSFIGPTPYMSFPKHFALQGESLDTAIQVFRDKYSGDNLLKAKIYDGLFEVFDFCKSNNIACCVATNKREDMALRVCEHFGISKYMKCIFGSDNKNGLTKTDIIRKCIEYLAIDKNLSVMIGDSPHDLKGAIENDIDFIGVEWGFGLKDENETQGIKLIKKPSEIIQILNFS